MSVARILAFNTGVQLAGKVVSTIIGVVVVGLMTRHLGQTGFGMYSTANAFLQFFAIILDFGLNVMIVQLLGEHAGDEAYEKRAVSATFTLRCLSAFFLLGLAPIIGLAFPYPQELKLALFALWGSFFVTALNQIIVGVQQRHLKMHVVAIGEVAGRLVLLIGVLVARVLGWGLIPIVTIVSVGSTLNFFINFFAARRYASFSWNIDVPFWETLIKRSWPIGLAILFNLIYFKADTLILSLFRSQAEVGIYSAAYRVLEILSTIPFMYAGVLLPMIAKAWATKDREHFSKLLGHSYDAMTLIAAPLVAGTFVLAHKGMTFVAGKEFTDSADVLRILIFAVGIIFFGTISSYAIVALDAQRKMLPIYIVTAILALAGYLLYIPTYGLWAAAWLTLFSESCVALGSTIMALRISSTHWHPGASIKALFAAAIMGCLIWPLQKYPLPIPLFVGIGGYSLLVLVSGAISKETLKELLSFRRQTPPGFENPLS